MKFLWQKREKKQEPSMGAGDLRFQTLIKNLGDGVIVYSPNLQITYMNGVAEQITGVRLEGIAGREISPNLLQVQNYKILTQIIFPALAPLVVQISETEWPQIVDLTTDEPPLKLRITTIKITNEDGSPLNFVKVIKDRTREENVIASKKEFLNVAAHQLRTPLTGISWAFEALAAESQNNENLKSTINDGLNLAHKALKIVNDLLDAARIEGGSFGYKFQEVEIIGLIKEMMAQAEITAQQANVKISFSAPESQIKIAADKERIGIALSNLVDNAIKYTSDGGVVSVSVDRAENPDFIKISVRDTGVGIPKDELPKIFTKFYRGSNVIQMEPNGSGLGLYITRNIIKNHGGEISVTSEAGRGTVFSLTLPTNPDLVPKKEIIYDAER